MTNKTNAFDGVEPFDGRHESRNGQDHDELATAISGTLATLERVRPTTVSLSELTRIGEELLHALSQDLNAEDLRDTPTRFAKWWKEFLEYDPGDLDRSFEFTHSAQLVAISGIRVWSICAHHLLPFWCDVSIGYVPRETVLGLSKFARCAHKHSHRPQLQERLCGDIAHEIEQLSGSPDVFVVARGEHLCMTMRGIRSGGVVTSTVVRGAFEVDAMLRSEFMRIAF